MPFIQKITPFLWFDQQAEEAANFYTGIFPNSRIVRVSRYPAVGEETHGGKAGSVMTVDFELEGQAFVALNAGPIFTFTEAVSFMIHCETQAEVNHYWERLTAGGGKESDCGWLKDKYGLSWQVTPTALMEAISDPDRAKAGRAMEAMMTMQKIDIATIQRAHAGES